MDIDCEDTPTLLTALGPKPIPSPEARQRAKERGNLYSIFFVSIMS